ncbi:hypothetical protein [Sphingomonas astaxanthinifaciens]|uniref:YtxH domain-containing protein n=1 Tax=Sphingomonas astaxanthinifaciens DSM 22298 TaxID=1123267 RepID=A0ABQ5Z4A7_9SPHN|nr:hypothetical protein [Sphingomonas astaxanthinifaciens]GLR46302.1 hypothetical protein GCM10007925_00130 [Sphingomonas astaxanthinifaciens DSM 22298]
MASKSTTSNNRSRTRTSRAKSSASSRAGNLRSKIEGRRGQATAAVKSHPYATVALGALAAGAGIAAFLLSRRESLPLEKWGQKVEDFAGQVEKKVKTLRKDGIDLDADSKTEIKTGAVAY